ncbi:hypothetical protein PanWU01x14_003970, partial [Parasponia andersonii]
SNLTNSLNSSNKQMKNRKLQLEKLIYLIRIRKERHTRKNQIKKKKREKKKNELKQREDIVFELYSLFLSSEYHFFSQKTCTWKPNRNRKKKKWNSENFRGV